MTHPLVETVATAMWKALYPTVPIDDDGKQETLVAATAALNSILATHAIVPVEPDDAMTIAADEAIIEVLNDMSFALKLPTIGFKAAKAAISSAPKVVE